MIMNQTLYRYPVIMYTNGEATHTFTWAYTYRKAVARVALTMDKQNDAMEAENITPLWTSFEVFDEPTT